MTKKKSLIVLGALWLGTSAPCFAQAAPPAPPAPQPTAQTELGYTDTPMIPGTQWHVHDSNRPRPPIVKPGTASTPEQPGQAPSDAIVLFDGTDLSQWVDNKNEPSGWIVRDGAMIVPPKGTPHGGAIHTTQAFGDCQLHLEFATPTPPVGSSQGRGNSGVFLMRVFEIQILDSYENETYADGQAGAVYGQMPPMVNPTRAPGEWQTYDIFFTAPRFAPDGALLKPACVTVMLNGVLVQNHTEIKGPTTHKKTLPYSPMPEKAPLELQDHNNPTKFRNIWIRPLETLETR